MGWVEKRTQNGVQYYHNPETNEVSWDRPSSLDVEGTDAPPTGVYHWLSHKTHAWLPARVLHSDGDMVRLETTIGHEIVQVKSCELGRPILKLEQIVDDLVKMDEVSEPAIIHTLRQRFGRDNIYTSVGDILVSINPFKSLPLYTPQRMSEYAHQGNRKLPPHTFKIASDAYKSVSLERSNCSILISGESGAGKTEATKQCLTFLAETAGSTSGVEQMVLAANPVLEAFGNAKTLRNNNSSRFGKYIEVLFEARGRIAGCKITNYLLEKSRIVTQARNERNYHVFYQLCQGAGAELQSKLGLEQPPSAFNLLNQSGCSTIDGMDETKEFEDLTIAMRGLDFNDTEVSNIFALTAAVLHLGNVAFESDGGEGSRVAPCSNEHLHTAARLLRVAPEVVAASLSVHHLEVGGERVKSLLNPEKAAASRNSLVKAIYARLFDWLVRRINDSMVSSDPVGDLCSIGILDIFGFEIFEKNSFEQLCINYCNEKLQQQFNDTTFKSEEETYRTEGIDFTKVEYIDNQDVLDLVEKPPKGILVMLDDEVTVPRGSDSNLLTKVIKEHKGNRRLVTDRVASTAFSIEHYAGQVRYDIRSFVEKNRDKLFSDLSEAMTTSKMQFLSETLFEKKRNGRTLTQAGQFRSQLGVLMKRLRSSRSHYIRCIKSNGAKVPGRFESVSCMEQLRYAGVFEAVSIRKSGYPFRFSHADFARRFRVLGPNERGQRILLDPKKVCVELIKRLAVTNPDLSQCKIGRTMVLYRAAQHRTLELQRALLVERAAVKVQSIMRSVLTREFVAEMKRVVPILRAAIKSRAKDELCAALEESKGLVYPLHEQKLAQGILTALEEEASLRAELESMCTHHRQYSTLAM